MRSIQTTLNQGRQREPPACELASDLTDSFPRYHVQRAFQSVPLAIPAKFGVMLVPVPLFVFRGSTSLAAIGFRLAWYVAAQFCVARFIVFSLPCGRLRMATNEGDRSPKHMDNHKPISSILTTYCPRSNTLSLIYFEISAFARAYAGLRLTGSITKIFWKNQLFLVNSP